METKVNKIVPYIYTLSFIRGFYNHDYTKIEIVICLEDLVFLNNRHNFVLILVIASDRIATKQYASFRILSFFKIMKIGFNLEKENCHALLSCRTICQDL